MVSLEFLWAPVRWARRSTAPMGAEPRPGECAPVSRTCASGRKRDWKAALGSWSGRAKLEEPWRRARDRWRGRWEQSRLRDQTRMFKPGLGTTPRESVFNFAKEKTTLNPPTPAQSSCSLFLWLSLQAPQHPRALSEEPLTL